MTSLWASHFSSGIFGAGMIIARAELLGAEKSLTARKEQEGDLQRFYPTRSLLKIKGLYFSMQIGALKQVLWRRQLRGGAKSDSANMTSPQ